jgi:F-type H+-transporting ATPase subunit a
MMFAAAPQISLPTQSIFKIGGFNITNSMSSGILAIILLFWLFIYTVRRLKAGRHTRLSTAVLWCFEGLFNTSEEILGSRELALKLAPLALAMFFFIIINNWLEILPIFGPLSWHGVTLFRGMGADMNFTFALAIITVVTAQLWALKQLGLKGSLSRYGGNPFKDPMHSFIGFLEFIAEFSRFIALSMRLFGNIFGGEVLLLVIGYISGFAAPVVLPIFLVLELFVGAIQAYIFFMLTVVFISLGSAPHDEVPATVS